MSVQVQTLKLGRHLKWNARRFLLRGRKFCNELICKSAGFNWFVKFYCIIKTVISLICVASSLISSLSSSKDFCAFHLRPYRQVFMHAPSCALLQWIGARIINTTVYLPARHHGFQICCTLLSCCTVCYPVTLQIILILEEIILRSFLSFVAEKK